MLQAASRIPVIRHFLSQAQLTVLANCCRGEEGEFFLQAIISFAERISAMPVTYGQEGAGEQAIVYLHYFLGGSDWYITEKDVCGGVKQAFGYAIINGDDQMAELGYISIKELVRCGAELDLYFTPRPLGEVMAERLARC